MKVLIVNDGPHVYQGGHTEGGLLVVGVGETVEVSEATAERILADHGTSKWHKFRKGLEAKPGEKIVNIEKGGPGRSRKE